MKKLLIVLALCFPGAVLADIVTILSVKQVQLGNAYAGDGAVVGAVGSAVSGGDGWDILGSAVGGAIIGDVLSDYEDGVEIRIRNAKGIQSTIVQPGKIHHYRLGRAELQRVHQNGEVSYRITPNA